MKVKYQAISYTKPAMPICEENIPKLGRKYDDVYRLIEFLKDIDTNDLYISNLIEKYYLEADQEFLDSPKVMTKKYQH